MSLVSLGKRLLEAARLGLEDEVQELMTNGAPFTTDWLGTSPLHLAAYAGHTVTAEVLVRAGVSRDARTKVDRTPLHMASQEGHEEIVKLLLSHGANVDARDMLNMTALHWAVERFQPTIVDILLSYGADCKIFNKFQKTALDIAEENQLANIIAALRTAQGLKVDTTPLYSTASNQDMTSTSSNSLPAVSTLQGFVTAAAAEAKCSASCNTPSDSILLRSLTAAAPKVAVSGSSTSILATLAALAEASTPLTEIDDESSNPYALSDAIEAETTQTYTLTEAGQLALRWKDSNEPKHTNKHKIYQRNRKVITIQQGDNGQTQVSCTDVTSAQPSDVTLTLDCTTIEDDDEVHQSIDHEYLQQQLESAQREAQQYKQRLADKEEEAEQYRQKLEKLSAGALYVDRPKRQKTS